MYCSSCGKEVSENINFCIFCGAKIEKDESISHQETQQMPQTPIQQQAVVSRQQGATGMAIAALICGILGLCCCPLGIVGIVFGLMERKNIADGISPQEGYSYATIGLILGLLGLPIHILGFILSFILRLFPNLMSYWNNFY